MRHDKRILGCFALSILGVVSGGCNAPSNLFFVTDQDFTIGDVFYPANTTFDVINGEMGQLGIRTEGGWAQIPPDTFGGFVMRDAGAYIEVPWNPSTNTPHCGGWNLFERYYHFAITHRVYLVVLLVISGMGSVLWAILSRHITPSSLVVLALFFGFVFCSFWSLGTAYRTYHRQCQGATAGISYFSDGTVLPLPPSLSLSNESKDYDDVGQLFFIILHLVLPFMIFYGIAGAHYLLYTHPLEESIMPGIARSTPIEPLAVMASVQYDMTYAEQLSENPPPVFVSENKLRRLEKLLSVIRAEKEVFEEVEDRERKIARIEALRRRTNE